jgi:hypothetical protein
MLSRKTGRDNWWLPVESVECYKTNMINILNSF